MTPIPRGLSALALSAAIAGASAARADIFCVETASQLEGALIAAGLNHQDDEIRIRPGTYVAPQPVGFDYSPGLDDENRGLVISGGWSQGCSRLSGHATETVLQGSADLRALLLFAGSQPELFTIRLLTITGATNVPGVVVIFSDTAAGSGVTIDRVIFRDNQYTALFVSMIWTPVRLTGCLFHHNDIATSSGAAAVIQATHNDVEVFNNTFTDNTVSGLGVVAGLRLESSDPQNMYLVNNIFWGNENVDVLVPDNTHLFSYNDYGVAVGGFLGSQNLQVDPLFQDPGSEDYRLRSNSPLIDAGDDSGSGYPIHRPAAHAAPAGGELGDRRPTSSGRRSSPMASRTGPRGVGARPFPDLEAPT